MWQVFCETTCVISFRPCTASMQDTNYLCSKDKETEPLKDEANWSISHSGTETKGFPVLRNSRIVGKWGL